MIVYSQVFGSHVVFKTTPLLILNDRIKKYKVEQLENFHKIIDDSKNIEVKINDDDMNLLLLRLLLIFFEHFKDIILYGEECNITLDKIQKDVRSNIFQ